MYTILYQCDIKLFFSFVTINVRCRYPNIYQPQFHLTFNIFCKTCGHCLLTQPYGGLAMTFERFCLCSNDIVTRCHDIMFQRHNYSLPRHNISFSRNNHLVPTTWSFLPTNSFLLVNTSFAQKYLFPRHNMSFPWHNSSFLRNNSSFPWHYIPLHEITARSYVIISRSHDIIGRSNDIIARSHEIISHFHGIISRSHDINNAQVPSVLPYHHYYCNAAHFLHDAHDFDCVTGAWKGQKYLCKERVSKNNDLNMSFAVQTV